jgi:hypothetical protein
VKFFSFLWHWGLNSEPYICWTGALWFELHSRPFCFGYFWDRVLFMSRPTKNMVLLSVLPHVNGYDWCMAPYPIIVWDGVSRTFCLDWPQAAILLISASWVTRIRRMSHCSWPISYIDSYYTTKVSSGWEVQVYDDNNSFNIWCGSASWFMDHHLLPVSFCGG